MKKLNSLFLFLIGIFCLTSCGEDAVTYTAPESLEVTNSELYFKSAGGTGNVEVVVKSAALQATSSVDWCTVSVSGGVVTATVTENGNVTSRSGLITITDGKLSSVFSVYQEGLACVIDTSNFQSGWGSDMGSTSFVVDSSSPFSITLSPGAESWVSYTIEGNTVTVNFAANDTGAFRIAQITVKSGVKEKTLSLFQCDINVFLGTWTAKYFDGTDNWTDQVIITKVSTDPADPNLDIKLFSLHSSPRSASYTLTLRGVYQNGAVRIAFGQRLGTYSFYQLTFGAYDSKGTAIFSATSGASCQLSPYLADDNTVRLTITDNGSLPNPMANLAVFALQSGFNRGYFEQIFDLVLSK